MIKKSSGRIWERAMLTVKDLAVHYQELRALRGVTLQVNTGDLVALIGSNGAGKTTLLNAISGLIPPASGQINWNGQSIVGCSPDDICQHGVIQVPEGRKLFARMTVEENLEMGAYLPTCQEQGPMPPKADKWFLRFFRVWPNGGDRLPAACPAVSSKWSRWRVPSWPDRSC
jgi:ABC-type branched-subunit amino acid transport system ATPase component